MLLPSVLPCENSFRISRSRTTRSQIQRGNYLSSSFNPLKHNTSSSTLSAKDISGAIGLGLSISSTTSSFPNTLSKPATRTNSSCRALQQILSLDNNVIKQSPASSSSRYTTLPATPSPSSTPTPQTPVHQQIPQTTPWTTPSQSVSSSKGDETPRANSTSSNSNYTYTIVTRNNKRKRNGDSIAQDLAPPTLNRYETPDLLATPVQPPPLLPAPITRNAMEIDTQHDEEDDVLLDDPFVTPKRSRVRGPTSKRICATRRNLGPWSEEEDKQLVGMVLAKLKLSDRDWAECANTLGRDGMSVGERWRNLVADGEVGYLNEKRKEERQKRARMSGSGSGRLEPERRRMTRSRALIKPRGAR